MLVSSDHPATADFTLHSRAFLKRLLVGTQLQAGMPRGEPKDLIPPHLLYSYHTSTHEPMEPANKRHLSQLRGRGE